MSESQKLQVRLSELRSSINGLLAKGDALTDDESGTLDKQTKELGQVEIRYRAAVSTETEKLQEADRLEQPAGEGSEVRRLIARASLHRYHAAIASGRSTDGAESELKAAYNVDGDDQIPVVALADVGDVEATYAASTTANLEGGEPQRSILGRIFASPIADALGVRMDSVSAGKPRHPVMTDGATAAQTAENTEAAAAVAPTFIVQELVPKRLTVRYSWTYEQSAQIGNDLESSLRRDLRMAMTDAQQVQILNGNGTAPNVRGFLTALSAQNPAPNTVTDYEAYLAALASAVDGLYASSTREVSILAGVETYRHTVRVLQDGSGESAEEALMRRSRSYRSSAHIPAAASNIQNSNILHSGMDANRGDSIAAIWPSITAVRDQYTSAATGLVHLTMILLWDLYAALRPAYRRFSTKIA